jgi:N-methylhydantoinase B
VQVLTPQQPEPVLWRGKIARHLLRRGDVARLITGGGGGYGSPQQRPVSEVIEDVKNGYVSLETAERIYGVRLDPETLTIIHINREEIL